MADVRVQEGETVENALRRFKRQVIQENIIGEVKRHSFYLKPGQKLRVKQGPVGAGPLTLVVSESGHRYSGVPARNPGI